MKAQRKPSESSTELHAIITPEAMALARFGPTDGLAIVQQTTLALGRHYADRYGLDMDDPEVMIVSVALATARHREFLLMRTLERALFERVVTDPEGRDYEAILLNSVQTGAFTPVNREIDRLHTRCGNYLAELAAMRKALEKDA